MAKQEQKWRSGWPALLIVGALAIGWWIYRTGPVTEPREEKRPPKIVKTVSPPPSTYSITVTADGSVIPARRVRIEPQVSGHIIRQHPALVPGGYLKQGEELYAIDPKLTELDLQETVAGVARAKAMLDEAQRKWDEGRRLAADGLIPDTELASLESTLRMQQSDLERLKASQTRNEELLKRHVVRAPFNAIVLDETVEIGQRVAPGDATATLVGTDEFWVRAALPTDQLPWVQIPSGDRSGARATVLFDTGNGQLARYSGEVIQRLSDLTETGRMARILLRVRDPLRLAKASEEPPLLLGSYVRVEIDAGQLRDVLEIDRAALREGDRIWLVDAQARLQVRPVTVRWRKDETVYIDSALQPGETLVVSDLRVALPGMEVRAQPTADAAAGGMGTTATQP